MKVSTLEGVVKRIDGELVRALTVDALRALKDELLALLAEEPSAQAQITPRISRVNLRLRTAAEKGDGDLAELFRAQSFHAQFYEVAKRMLEPAVFKILCREASQRRDDAVRIELPPRPEEPAPAPTPLVAPLHRLVLAANHQPIKFDPTRLFKEFGRERVLATWNLLPAESRPETAAEFRRILFSPESV